MRSLFPKVNVIILPEIGVSISHHFGVSTFTHQWVKMDTLTLVSLIILIGQLMILLMKFSSYERGDFDWKDPENFITLRQNMRPGDWF